MFECLVSSGLWPGPGERVALPLWTPSATPSRVKSDSISSFVAYLSFRDAGVEWIGCGPKPSVIVRRKWFVQPGSDCDCVTKSFTPAPCSGKVPQPI